MSPPSPTAIQSALTVDRMTPHYKEEFPMKNLMVAFVASILSLQPAFAQNQSYTMDAYNQQLDEQMFESEEGAISDWELQTMADPQAMKRDNTGEIIAGVIIGGIIGAIAADALDRQDEGRYNNGRGHGGFGPGRHPGRPGPIVRPGPIYRQVTCFAQNRRGEVFRVTGQQARRVQERAMDKCQARSLQCRPMGCQVAGW